MRIATWNINGLRARLDFIALWLEARQPDVLGLQELKMEDHQFPHDVFEALGYHAITHGQKSWNGVAILSRRPTEAVQVGLPGEEAFGARLLRAHIGALDFTTVYCPNGKSVSHDDYARKLAWFDSLHDYWLQSPRQSLAVLCGDFNIVPAPIDSHLGDAGTGEIFHTDDERVRFGALLDAPLIDLYRSCHPSSDEYSWWDYRGGAFHRGHGLRIDMLLGTPELQQHVQRVEIDREFRKKQDGFTASDHAPVYADIDLD